MSELKEKYIQFCCDFYNEHAPKDKLWFGRMYDECLQEHNKRNSTMYRWQFPLMILKDRQAEIDQLKTELALCREENKGLVGKVSEQRQINKSQLNKLINKSVRLTDAEFEYKRIRGLQAKDCLQIMRLTARNEKLNNELKTMRGVNDINLTR
ncbi:MAG: hypothetical protein RSC68_27585 [Acinetobacter sp.]